jgi:hypothetical protein
MTQGGAGKKRRNRPPLKKKEVVKILIILYKGGLGKIYLQGPEPLPAPLPPPLIVVTLCMHVFVI